MPAVKSKKSVAPKEAAPVVYQEVEVKLYTGDNALTVDQAKELLGWQEEGEDKKFGGDYLLTDDNGKKVRCLNNTQNRPFGEPWARRLAQDQLKGNWRFNGETIVIGKSGQVLSGQHRLISLVLAEQQRIGKQALHWKPYWKSPITMPCLVVFGVDEGSETTRTLDNVKPRTLSDVLFCDPTMFGKCKPSERKVLTRMVEYAVKFLWKYTGLDKNAFAPYRTHSESLDFLDRHPHVVKAVKHVWEENQPAGKGDDDKPLPLPIGRYLAPSYAAGMLYLMGCSATDVDVYPNMETPSEKKLSWDHWDKACEFWVLLGAGSKEMKEVQYAFAALADQDTGEGKGTLVEQMCVISHAWDAFKEGRAPTADDMKLEYEEDDNGRHLSEKPYFGGIYLEVEDDEEEEAKPEPDEGGEPTQEQIAERSEEQRAKRAELAAKLAANRKAKKAAAVPANGDGQAE